MVDGHLSFYSFLKGLSNLIWLNVVWEKKKSMQNKHCEFENENTGACLNLKGKGGAPAVN